MNKQKLYLLKITSGERDDQGNGLSESKPEAFFLRKRMK
jgi:hypothetical protein